MQHLGKLCSSFELFAQKISAKFDEEVGRLCFEYSYLLKVDKPCLVPLRDVKSFR